MGKIMERAQRQMNESGLAKPNLTKAKLQRGKRNGGKMLLEQGHEQHVLSEKALKANPAEADFINILSHELRMPIHVIVGCGDLLLDGAWGMLPENQKTILAKIKQNACYLLDLITDLIELNRLDGGMGLARGHEEINVDGLLEEVEAMIHFMPKADGAHLDLKRTPGLPPLFSDRDKLKIILRNLVGNAVKFTQRGKITIAAHFNPEVQVMEISVRDTGVGIDEKDRQRIFDMFWQGDKSNSRRFGGVGLGLYIVKRLGDQIGAKIEVESEKGRGSLFRLRIPIRPD
jgi:signal transduction histidine kinase